MEHSTIPQRSDPSSMPISSCRFYVDVYGDHHAQTLHHKIRNVVEDAGATVVESIADASHVIVPHTERRAFKEAEAKGKLICSPVWLIACLQASEILDTSAHHLYRPMPGESIEGISNVRQASITGFVGLERLLAQVALMSMGCEFSLQYDPKRTSLLVSNDVDDTSRKAEAARRQGVPIVNLMWALDGLATGRLQETKGYQQNTSIDIVFRRANATKDLDVMSAISDSVDEDEGEGQSVLDSSIQDRNIEETPEKEEEEEQGDDDDETPSPSKVPQPVSEVLMGDMRMMETTTDDDLKATKATADAATAETQSKVEEDHIFFSQDNDDRATKRQKIKPGPSKDVQSTKNVGSSHTNSSSLERFHATLSGMHSPEQRSIRAQLADIGVKCSAGVHSWSSKFTHVIAPSVRRNQKCLSALAAGAWLVSPAFVDACVQTGGLVAEEPYELVTASESSFGAIDAGVARHWRLRKEKTGAGAFEGIRCAVGGQWRGAPSRQDIMAIVKAGGGTIVRHTEPHDVYVLASPSPLMKVPVTQGGCIVDRLYIVEWLVFPQKRLDEHLLFDCKRSSLLELLEARRKRESGRKDDLEGSSPDSSTEF